MPKYLFQATYTAEGAKGLLKEGGTSRSQTVARLVEGLGGGLEAFYYAFGDNDVFAIVDLPNHETAAAFSLSVSASGTVKVRTVILMTPEEVDAAAKKTIDYRPPGQ
jgi:uncharacterized protein with GYD domain